MTNEHRTRKTWKSVLLTIVLVALAVALARSGHGHGMWDGPV
jgi:hypothetical protein